MTKSFEFRQILVRSYHCKRCKKDFKCAKKIPEKQRNELEDKFQKTQPCKLCENQHIRCNDDRCSNCCEKFKCNDPEKCDHCKELGIECEYTFPRTQEEFEKYSSLDYIIHQFESTESKRVYNQAYFIFNTKMTMRSVKKLFKDDEIWFPPKEGAICDSTHNRDYAKKKYNPCKLHHNPYDKDPQKRTFCKCDLSDSILGECKFCNEECCSHRTLARWEGSSDIVGPFIFGTWRNLPGSNEKQVVCEEINRMKLTDVILRDNLIRKGIPPNEILKNPAELLPRFWISNFSQYEEFEKKRLISETKYIPGKKHYPKNFFFYGDSGPGKSTLMENLASALTKDRSNCICIKAKDQNYIDEYQNQACITKDELTHDTFNFQDLMSCCEKNSLTIKQRKKKPIEIVSKFHVFTAQDSFDDIFCFEKCKSKESVKSKDKHVKSKNDPVKNEEKRNAIFRRFTKAREYTHGYIIKLEGRYVRDGRVKFIIESDEFNKPGDLNDFIQGRFDIKFAEDVYLKIEVDMSYILGGIICRVNDKENSFWVYNKYWENDLPSDFVDPKNSSKIDKKLREKIIRKENTRNVSQENDIPNKNPKENILNEIVPEENSSNENIPVGDYMKENNLDNVIDEEQRQIQSNHEESNKKHLFDELDISEDLDRHVDKKNKK
ncbi:4716_t:CDS:2 [Cetraspora pellucida]|uniref:4716_t:CDS:1 n=1 Tax=Cetraspora pellucida TaxID=1433469 RepID=A0A9N8Z0A8_9GLOM|nr:4716_t:CDS:2 [Cetraspora pellucida]